MEPDEFELPELRSDPEPPLRRVELLIFDRLEERRIAFTLGLFIELPLEYDPDPDRRLDKSELLLA
jgi:hypothetical protein